MEKRSGNGVLRRRSRSGTLRESPGILGSIVVGFLAFSDFFFSDFICRREYSASESRIEERSRS